MADYSEEDFEGVAKIKDAKEVKKIFNRGFTKGFLFQEENNKFVQTYRPNHLGIEIGKVIDIKGNNAIVKLSDTVAGIEETIQNALEIIKNNRSELK